MAKKKETGAYTDVRRRDRTMTDDAWIKMFLLEAPMGNLATVDGDQPFINSNLFVYDEIRHVIYMHTARTGRTRDNIDKAQAVCFSISEMGRLLPADVALEFSVEYRGVTVFGKASVVKDPGEAAGSMRLMLEKYCPHLVYGKDYREVVPEELKRTSVYRIDIDSWVGKQKRVEEDFPGAFRYDEYHSPSDPL